MRQKVTKEYFYWVKKILKTNLNPKNKKTAINQLGLPILKYTFGIIDWPQNAIDPIDIKTRKLLTLNKMFYKLQSHSRLYLRRDTGWMLLININNWHRATVISMAIYIYIYIDILETWNPRSIQSWSCKIKEYFNNQTCQ